jgi:general secretion pathway protein G
MRYCPDCYRPVPGRARSRSHVETARTVDSTRRADPTIVFLPEVREARLRRNARRKRAAILALAVTVLMGGLLTVWLTLSHKSGEQRTYLARSEMARQELATIADALDRFHEDIGRYPTAAEGLGGLMHRPAAFQAVENRRLDQWLGPYLDTLPEVDPWGEDYVYEPIDDGRSFRLYSHGPGGDMGSAQRLEVRSSEPR